MVEYRCEGFSLRVRGHAGDAPPGENLVCAAVTGIVYALAAYVKKLDDGRLEQLQLRLEPGDAWILALPRKESLSQLTGAYDMALSGLGLLAEKYPEQVRAAERPGRY